MNNKFKNIFLTVRPIAAKILAIFFYRSLGRDELQKDKNTTLLYRNAINEELIYHYGHYKTNGALQKNQEFKVDVRNLISIWIFNSKEFELFDGYLYKGRRVLYSEGNFTIRMINLFRSKFTYVDKDVLYFSNSNQSHYGHFIFYVVPMLAIARKHFDIRTVYAGKFVNKKFFHEVMHLCFPDIEIVSGNIKAKRIIYVNIDKLKSINGRKVLSSGIINLSKESLASLTRVELGEKHKNIFIGRGDVKWRNLVNEGILIEKLKKFGFVYLTMDNLSPSQQAFFFHNAKVILGVHGGAMSNVIHAKKETKVIELMAFEHEDYTTLELCAATGSIYTRVIGDPIDLQTPPAYRNIQVDTNRILELLSDDLNKLPYDHQTQERIN